MSDPVTNLIYASYRNHRQWHDMKDPRGISHEKFMKLIVIDPETAKAWDRRYRLERQRSGGPMTTHSEGTRNMVRNKTSIEALAQYLEERDNGMVDSGEPRS